MKKSDNVWTYRGMAGTVEYSVPDRCFFGKLLNVDGLYLYEGNTIEELENDFHMFVDQYIADHNISEARCSGSLNVRVDPNMHEKLDIYSSALKESLNSAVNEAINSYVVSEQNGENPEKNISEVAVSHNSKFDEFNTLTYYDLVGTVNYSLKKQCFCGNLINAVEPIEYVGKDIEDLITNFHRAVDKYISEGKDYKKAYLGSFNVRMNPELHERLEKIAEKNGQSLNKTINCAIEKFINSKNI